VRHALEVVLLRVVGGVVRALPLRFMQSLAARAARAAFRLGGKRTRWALLNLRIAYPDESEERLREIGAESYAHMAWNMLDWIRAERWGPAEIEARFSVSGLEYVQQALAPGQGVLSLSLHLGNFELGGRAFGVFGIPTSVVARPMRNALLYDSIVRKRAEADIETIAHRDAVRPILRALRKGRAVFVLNDQYSRRSRGVFVPLFGALCSTSAGVATLSLRTGAPVIPVYVIRDAPDHHTIYFHSAVPSESSGDRAADVVKLTARYNEVLEGFIRKHPEQWIWNHRRFRHSPDVPESPYG
jgi:KDO2-lipid IV(A) lauroyltransferase